MKHRDNIPRAPVPSLEPMPRVTVQLPIYNEMYVADRLIQAVCDLDYPRELLEIQVLDDSTDETREIAARVVERQAARGFDIAYYHRTDRRGFKAGALEAGLREARGRVHRHLRRGFRSAPRLPHENPAALRRRQGRHGPGALGAHQPGLFAAHADPGDPARRALRARARRPQPGRALLQLQRDGRHLAAGRNRHGGRLAARHPDGRPRPQLPGPARRLEVRLPAGSGCARPKCPSR